MKPVKHPLVPGPGIRTPATMLRLDERDRYLREAARFFPGCGNREIARRLRSALLTYRSCAWQRDFAKDLCPVRYAGTVKAALWKTLKAVDAIPGDRTIRAALAQPARLFVAQQPVDHSRIDHRD